MEDVRQQLSIIIKSLFEVDMEPEVVVAPEGQSVQGRQAEFATNVAMRLAKEVKRAPREIASEIVEIVNGDKSLSEISKEENDEIGGQFLAEVAGPGFLNFISRDEYFLKKLADFEQNFEKNIENNSYHDMIVVSEFSDPNPFKVLHVGHLYTSIVGESISRLLEFAGARVVRANFGGDVGLHVAKTLWALGRRRRDLELDFREMPQSGESQGVGTPHPQPGDSSASAVTNVPNPREKSNSKSLVASEIAEMLAKCYVEGTRAYEEDEKAHKEIVVLNKKVYEIAEMGVEALEDFGGVVKNRDGVVTEEDEELAQMYWWGREASYAYFDEFYEKVGVRFDKYYPESTVAQRGIAVIRKELKSGVYEKSNGAVVFKGEPYGLHTRVFINKEGLPTYEAKDVGLIHQKWDDYHFDKSVVITGNDIIDYMKVVLKSVEQYRPELVERTIHLTHGNVRLPGNEKMSSRKGNFLKAVEVLDEVRNELSESSSNEQVALGAVKYAFLKYKIGGNIEFNIKESVEMTGNSGPYLQYACVRARKIMAAVSGGPRDEKWEPNEWERALASKMMQYGTILGEAVTELAPYKVCAYLYELAQVFNRFYEHTRVVGSEFEAERAGLVGAYVKVLEHGLGILGIEIPEKM